MTCPVLVNQPGLCGWCGKPLSSNRPRWCSTRCNRTYVANHRWTQAKAVAKRAAARPGGYLCAACDEVFKVVEVNHIVPCKGKHGTWGCHHHQTNLSVLCIPCHRAETNRQRVRGWT